MRTINGLVQPLVVAHHVRSGTLALDVAASSFISAEAPRVEAELAWRRARLPADVRHVAGPWGHPGVLARAAEAR